MMEDYRRLCLIASAIMIAQAIIILRLVERSLYASPERNFKIIDFQKYREAAQGRAKRKTVDSDSVSCIEQKPEATESPPDLAG